MFLKVIISCRKGKTWGNSLQIPCLGKFWSLRYKKNLLNHSQRINKLTYEKVARRYNDFLFFWSALPSWKGSFRKNNVHVGTVPSIMTQSCLQGSQIAVKNFFFDCLHKVRHLRKQQKDICFFFHFDWPHPYSQSNYMILWKAKMYYEATEFGMQKLQIFSCIILLYS